MTGRVSMRNLSRWTSKGGSYRTIQRFFNTVVPWGRISWIFFRTYLLDAESPYILAGDETVVSKSGDSTSGLARFFLSVYGRSVPGLAFFSLSLVSIKERRSYPLVMEQLVRGAPATESRDEADISAPLTDQPPLVLNANAGIRRGVGTETRRMSSSTIP